MHTDVEALFQQFCRTRDPAVLGLVFDRCAEDLFAVALHLATDRAAAEDLLQATFLVAIERAATWQPQRPLQPWLLGILYREAKVQRRRLRRRVDAQRLAARGEVAPPQSALDAEALQAVTRALASVPVPYREVVELHLVQALAPAAIAVQLRRSPGAVRTQLWRGLERLRALLPKGLAVSLAAGLQAQAPLAAVRARVLEASAEPLLTPASLVIAGGALVKKGLAAVVVILVAGSSWLLWRTVESPIVPASQGGSAPVAAATTSPGTEAHDAAPTALRLDAGTPRTTLVEAAGLPGSAVAPVDLPVLVVDLAGVPVVDAEVLRFEPAVPQLPDGRKTTPQNRDGTVLREQLRTDAHGRVTLRVQQHCLVSARKAGCGASGDHILRPGARVLPDELRLVLQPTGEIRGVVLQADGAPAAGALARAFTRHGEQDRSTWMPGVTTDAEGRFAMEVLAGSDEYWLQASRGSECNRPRPVRVAAGQVVEITLQFAGAWRIRGQVVDANGAPAVARVLLHGEPSSPTDGRDWSGTCDAAGRFEFEPDAAGAYDLVAGIAGCTPAETKVVLETARPEVDVTLRLQPFAAVEGRVVDERNGPLAGRLVALVPETDPDAAAPFTMRSSLIGTIERPTTAADGSFRALAPAGWRCRVMVEALAGNRELWSRSDVFATPASGVVLVVRAADAEGFVLAGHVVSAADGAPIAAATIERIHRTDRRSSAHPVGRSEAGVFRVGPFPVGRQYDFTFEAEGFARTVVGPFDATVRCEEIVVRLPKCGTVRCRVLYADGTAAVGAFVSLQREVDDPFGRAWQGTTGRDGRIEFRDVEPRRFLVHAWVVRGVGESTVAPVTVLSGLTSDVVVTLPR